MIYLYQETLKKLALSVILLTTLLTAQNALAAQKSLPIGPEVGSKAPSISVLNNKNKQETIHSLSAEKGLIILFFRSADWCPFCKRHLIEFNGQAQKFRDLGYGLAAISYDNNDVLSTFSAQQNISYPLLSDQHAKTMLAYGILNADYKAGDMNYGIPYPGVVVINKAGIITQKYFFQGYKKRVKFTELYTQLKNRSPFTL